MRFALRFPARGALLVSSLILCFATQGGAEAQGDAKAKIPEAPNLAGQNGNYLIAQLTAFKSGERKNEMMSVVIQDLSDSDIENLAAYYSAIEVSVGKIPGQ